jgi:hypothetical protein
VAQDCGGYPKLVGCRLTGWKRGGVVKLVGQKQPKPRPLKPTETVTIEYRSLSSSRGQCAMCRLLRGALGAKHPALGLRWVYLEALQACW